MLHEKAITWSRYQTRFARLIIYNVTELIQVRLIRYLYGMTSPVHDESTDDYACIDQRVEKQRETSEQLELKRRYELLLDSRHLLFDLIKAWCLCLITPAAIERFLRNEDDRFPGEQWFIRDSSSNDDVVAVVCELAFAPWLALGLQLNLEDLSLLECEELFR